MKNFFDISQTCSKIHLQQFITNIHERGTWKDSQIISQCIFENTLKDISKVVFRRLHLNSHIGRFIHLNLSKEFCELVTVQTILDEFQFLSDSHLPFDVFHSKELEMSWSYQQRYNFTVDEYFRNNKIYERTIDNKCEILVPLKNTSYN